MNIKEISQTKASTIKHRTGEQPASESIWNREISLGGNKISDKEKFTLYHQLHNLIDAGMDIRCAFEVLESQIRSKKTRDKVASIRKEVVNGKTLSDAMADSDYFSKYEYFSIRIGEETGRLGEVLKQLFEYFEEKKLAVKELSKMNGSIKELFFYERNNTVIVITSTYYLI